MSTLMPYVYSADGFTAYTSIISMELVHRPQGNPLSAVPYSVPVKASWAVSGSPALLRGDGVNELCASYKVSECQFEWYEYGVKTFVMPAKIYRDADNF